MITAREARAHTLHPDRVEIQKYLARTETRIRDAMAQGLKRTAVLTRLRVAQRNTYVETLVELGYEVNVVSSFEDDGGKDAIMYSISWANAENQ